MAEQAVTAIVVNYQSGNDLETCLPALLGDREHLARVVVVDNSSTDESWRHAAEVAERDSRVLLIRSDRNLGLAGGVNLAMREVSTPYAAVLNPDVTVDPQWLGPLIDEFENHPNTAVACPLISIEGTTEVNSTGQHIHVTGLGFNRGLHQPADSWPVERQLVGGLHGAAFIVRSEFLRELGGWDERGFLYHEDVALSWDALLAGHDIVCLPESRVTHDYHLTMYPDKYYLLERNRWALLLSHLRVGRLFAISPALALTEVMTWGLALLRGSGFLKAKARAAAWIWKNRSEIRAWRREVFARPSQDASNLYSNTFWSYPLRQMGILGGERGDSSRVPPGGLPV